MANQRLAKLLDDVLTHSWDFAPGHDLKKACLLCGALEKNYPSRNGTAWIYYIPHERHCPIPRLRKERYEARRERKQERDVRPFTRYFLRHIQVFDGIIAELRSAIRECEAYIRNYKDKTYDRNRKAQLEYRLSQIKRELYHREHTRKEGRASCKTNN